jgi:hypothetical protein
MQDRRIMKSYVASSPTTKRGLPGPLETITVISHVLTRTGVKAVGFNDKGEPKLVEFTKLRWIRWL